jgi:hypothetical protein
MRAMLRLTTKPTRNFSPLLVYALIIAAAFAAAHSRVQSAAKETALVASTGETNSEIKPFFSISTNRTYSSAENPHLSLDHRGLDSLDFRVYRLNDPQQFFTQLNDPHQIGETEEEQLAQNLSSHPSFLERVHGVKLWAYVRVRNYFRDQLTNDTRRSFHQKVRASDSDSLSGSERDTGILATDSRICGLQLEVVHHSADRRDQVGRSDPREVALDGQEGASPDAGRSDSVRR